MICYSLVIVYLARGESEWMSCCDPGDWQSWVEVRRNRCNNRTKGFPPFGKYEIQGSNPIYHCDHDRRRIKTVGGLNGCGNAIADFLLFPFHQDRFNENGNQFPVGLSQIY